MLGKQEYQPQLFSEIDIEKLIPQNHLLRKVDKILDLSFIRTMAAELYCENNGRPSVDPELFFRICLLTYFYDIPSDRKACEEIQYNLAYRWFCRLNLEDKVPDHSSLTRIRERLGVELFKEIFEHIVWLCLDKKVASGKKIMMDGTLVKADAALNSMVELDEYAGLKEPTEESKYIKGKRFSNKTHISRTDPESSLAGKMGEPKLLRYKVHSIADLDSRVILDTHVTAGSEMEGTIMMDRIHQYEDNFNLEVEEVIADRGYGYGENLNALEEKEIKSFVPRFHTDAGESLKRDAKGFKYDEKKDCYICPKGYELNPVAGPTPMYVRYQMLGRICPKCPLFEKCLNTASQRTRRSKFSKSSTFPADGHLVLS